MAEALKILVIDDHPENANANIELLRHSLSEASMPNAVISALSESDKDFVIGTVEQISGEWVLDPEKLPKFKMFDGMDIIFIDYQLGAFKDHSFLTAEDLAGWIRAFSSVKLIIILNRFFDVDFDLTMTQGFIPTAADMHMNATLLDCPGMWKLQKWDESAPREKFRPWMWPELAMACEDTVKCRAEINELLKIENVKILDYLELGGEVSENLTHNAMGFLNPTSKTPASATFTDLLKYGRLGVPPQIRAQLADSLQYPEVKAAAVNILVGSLRRWLASMVLGPQDVLIDIPHLIQRMPWILGGNDCTDIDWSGYAQLYDISILPDDVKEFLYSKPQWLSRTTFFMAPLQRSTAILKYYEEYSAQCEDSYKFLEDYSVFVPSVQAEQFAAAFDSMWSTRYVSSAAVESGRLNYAPKVRLV